MTPAACTETKPQESYDPDRVLCVDVSSALLTRYQDGSRNRLMRNQESQRRKHRNFRRRDTVAPLGSPSRANTPLSGVARPCEPPSGTHIATLLRCYEPRGAKSSGSPMPRGERIAKPAERDTRLTDLFFLPAIDGARECRRRRTSDGSARAQQTLRAMSGGMRHGH